MPSDASWHAVEHRSVNNAHQAIIIGSLGDLRTRQFAFRSGWLAGRTLVSLILFLFGRDVQCTLRSAIVPISASINCPTRRGSTSRRQIGEESLRARIIVANYVIVSLTTAAIVQSRCQKTNPAQQLKNVQNQDFLHSAKHEN